MRQIMSYGWIMHIHGLDTKSMSWSPICFNELGSQGERLNFSFEFQTEKVKREFSSAREKATKGGEQRCVLDCEPKTARLQPRKVLFVSLCGLWFHIVNIRSWMDTRWSFFFFGCIIHTMHGFRFRAGKKINIARCSYFIQFICRVNWDTWKSLEDNEFHLIPFYYI